MTVVVARNGISMDTLGEASLKLRHDRARTKAMLSAGVIPLKQIMDSPTPGVEGLPLLDLIRLLPGFGHARLMMLNKYAIRDGINLMVLTGKASARTREWVGGHVVTSLSGRNTLVYVAVKGDR